MAWGRAVVGGAGAGAGAGGEGNKGGVNGEASASKESRRINVLATGSVDQTIKVGPCFFFSTLTSQALKVSLIGLDTLARL